LTFPGGSCYQGHFERGRFQDKEGIYTWSSGDIYEGELVDHQRHGVGTNTSSKGFEFKGTWQDNLPSGGEGILKVKAGDGDNVHSFHSKWDNGLMEGAADIKWHQGS
ncbi:unnamed protein product, partial [Polarella glacialis]